MQKEIIENNSYKKPVTPKTISTKKLLIFSLIVGVIVFVIVFFKPCDEIACFFNFYFSGPIAIMVFLFIFLTTFLFKKIIEIFVNKKIILNMLVVCISLLIVFTSNLIYKGGILSFYYTLPHFPLKIFLVLTSTILFVIVFNLIVHFLKQDLMRVYTLSLVCLVIILIILPNVLYHKSYGEYIYKEQKAYNEEEEKKTQEQYEEAIRTRNITLCFVSSYKANELRKKCVTTLSRDVKNFTLKEYSTGFICLDINDIPVQQECLKQTSQLIFSKAKEMNDPHGCRDIRWSQIKEECYQHFYDLAIETKNVKMCYGFAWDPKKRGQTCVEEVNKILS